MKPIFAKGAKNSLQVRLTLPNQAKHELTLSTNYIYKAASNAECKVVLHNYLLQLIDKNFQGIHYQYTIAGGLTAHSTNPLTKNSDSVSCEAALTTTENTLNEIMYNPSAFQNQMMADVLYYFTQGGQHSYSVAIAEDFLIR